MQTSPCEAWEPLCAKFPEDPTEGQQEIIDNALLVATEILWKRTKKQFGMCEYTIRPCRKDCAPSGPLIPTTGWFDVAGWRYPFPALIGGEWFNLACGKCKTGCSCDSISEVRLPYPVQEVTQVLIDGEELPSDAYRVDEYMYLVRLDGQEWPKCNDLNLDDTEEGTWSVTALYGQEVPYTGRMAVGELATEIYRHCTGDEDCQLPTAVVTQITRQGVSKTLFNGDFSSGNIGLYWCDLFLSQENPTHTGTATILNLDGPTHRRVNT